MANNDAPRSLAKRRMMFVVGEDLYYLTYTTLLILNELKCSATSPFIDHRKLAYIADLVGTAYLPKRLNSYAKRDVEASGFDRTLLGNMYSRGLARVPVLFRLLHTLESRKLIGLRKSDRSGAFDIWIPPNLPASLLDKNLFKFELQNLKELRGILPLRIVTLDRLLSVLFANRGILVWRG